MARGARKPLPLTLQVTHNPKTGFYEGEEDGITYQLTYEQLNAMKYYFRGSQGFAPRITNWYNSLSRIEKPKVKRLNVPPVPDDFTPDQEWPDA